MDKVVLNNDDMNFLLEWRDKNQDLVRTTICPLKKVKIVAVEVGIILTCIRSERELTVSITQQGKSKGKMVFEILPFGMYRLVKSSTNIYGKDFKRIKKRGYNINQLEKVIGFLAEQKPLPQKYKDHSLSGDYSDCRECHITPDWLLIYRIVDDELLLVLT